VSNKILNINNSDVVKYTNLLESTKKSRMPAAIRGTLNSLALDMKKRTILESSKQTFEQRRKTFFKAKSSVILTRSRNIKSMKSQVGFKGGNKIQAVADLEQQEHGGTIKGRHYVPADSARTGKNHKKNVRAVNRIGGGKLKFTRIGSKKTFHKQVRKVGKGGNILYRNSVFNVRSIKGAKVKLNLLYNYNKSGVVKVKKTKFMRRATHKTYKRTNTVFVRQVKRQLRQHFKG
tara:strand:- start:401 stop:1099 length:699 start_codon:yes stop_codon:yes gene_type:complete